MVFLIGSFAALEGCASTFQAKPEHQSDFFNHTSMAGVASEAVVPHVHPQTKVNWSAYDKIQLNPVVIANDVSGDLSSEQQNNLKELAEAFHDMLAQRLSQDYALVKEPASGSMLIQVTIRHAERSWVAPQVLSKVSWQLQALNSVLAYFRGKPAFAGEITIEFTVQDSLSGQLLLTGIDRRVGGQNLFDKEVFNSWGDVQNSLEFWTEQSAYQLCLARKGSHCSQPKA
jgi:hypothetical protein